MEPAVTSGLTAASLEGPATEVQDFDKIVQLHWSRIFRYVLASVRDRDAAQTLTQECFWKAYKGWKHFRGDSSVNTWLMRIAVNTVRDFARSRRLQFWRHKLASTPDAPAILDRMPDRAMSPEARAVIQEQVQAIWEATESLSQKQRTVFLLRFVEEMSMAEIAEAAGTTEGAVKVHLFRALQTIRRRLRRSQ